jgi:hypothetical protein
MYFREFRPAATIGYSIDIFRLDPDEVRAYRVGAGLNEHSGEW